MAPQRANRRSRKARAARRRAAPPPVRAGAEPDSAPAARVTPRVNPRAGPGSSSRREQREAREREAARARAQARRTLGTYGERPRSVFDPIPVSEIAILAGMVAVVIGALEHGGPALSVGAIVCALGVLEFTAREHFSGYRSHATLLAAFPAIAVEIALALFVGVPARRILLLAPAVPIFAFSFWLLNRSFAGARHSRAARPPAT